MKFDNRLIRTHTKIIIVLVCLIALGGLCYNSYITFYRYAPTINQFLESPDRFEGKLGYNRGQISYQDNLTLFTSGKEIMILEWHETPKIEPQKIPPAKFGTSMVLGYYKRPNIIQVINFRNENYNYLKYIVSLFAVIFVIYMFFREWKITWQGIESKDKEKEKNPEKKETRLEKKKDGDENNA